MINPSEGVVNSKLKLFEIFFIRNLNKPLVYVKIQDTLNKERKDRTS